MNIPISISTNKTNERIVETKALLDTGAGGKFIDQNFVLRENIRTHKLAKPIVTFHITDPTPSLSPPETFRRRIVDHQHYQSYAPYFHPDNSRLSPSPPAPYHMQNHPYPILGTSLVNGLRPTHASLFGISDYGYAQSRYHIIQFTSPHVYSFHHMLVSYYHAVLYI